MWFDRQPGRFHQGAGLVTAPTPYQHQRQGIALLKQLGHNSFRTSLSRLYLISDGTDEVNPEAIEFHNNVIDGLLVQGTASFITLLHFDMPMVMQEKGGQGNHEMVETFGRHAQTCSTLFGNQVERWFISNKPVVPVEGDYLYDFHYPNAVDFKRATTVTCHAVLAHSTAVRAYRVANHDGEIGVVPNLTPSYPRSQNPADVRTVYHADLLFNHSFLDPVLKGEYLAGLVGLLKEYDQLPACQPGDSQLTAEDKTDLLGINYYQSCRAKCCDSAVNPDTLFTPEWPFGYYRTPGRKANPYCGWEIYRSGIHDIITSLRDNYGNPCYFIPENGMDVKNEQRFIRQEQVNDSYRIEFAFEHLR